MSTYSSCSSVANGVGGDPAKSRFTMPAHTGKAESDARNGLQLQGVDRQVEVPMRSLGDAADAHGAGLSPIDRVQIHLEDLLLRQQDLEPHREERLTELAPEGPLASQEQSAR